MLLFSSQCFFKQEIRKETTIKHKQFFKQKSKISRSSIKFAKPLKFCGKTREISHCLIKFAKPLNFSIKIGALSFVPQSFVIHIICPSDHLYYSSFILHIICTTHHLYYTSFILHIICTTHHLS